MNRTSLFSVISQKTNIRSSLYFHLGISLLIFIFISSAAYGIMWYKGLSIQRVMETKGEAIMQNIVAELPKQCGFWLGYAEHSNIEISKEGIDRLEIITNNALRDNKDILYASFLTTGRRELIAKYDPEHRMYKNRYTDFSLNSESEIITRRSPYNEKDNNIIEYIKPISLVLGSNVREIKGAFITGLYFEEDVSALKDIKSKLFYFILFSLLISITYFSVKVVYISGLKIEHPFKTLIYYISEKNKGIIKKISLQKERISSYVRSGDLKRYIPIFYPGKGAEDVSKSRQAEEEVNNIRYLGPYERLRLDNTSGGMASIYHGYKKSGRIKMEVAVKIPSNISRDIESRFLNEARTIAYLGDHDNLVPIRDFGNIVIDNAEHLAIEMPYIHGVNLSKLLHDCQDRITVSQALYIIKEICSGLDYAHNKKMEDGTPLNIIHRDINPENILISFNGEVKITDFGIAKNIFETGRTQDGFCIGKPCYFSPEQASFKKLDQRSDIFSLGLVFYEIITGKKAYPPDNPDRIFFMAQNAEIVSPFDIVPDLPESLVDIIFTLVEKDIDKRYQKLEDVLKDIDRFIRGNQPYYNYDKQDLGRFMQQYLTSNK